MAFWDFVKDAGKSVFGSAEAAEAKTPEQADTERKVKALEAEVKALGLDWVETDDARMHEVWQNREELPFVKDDLVWPTYLELCDLLRIEPYKPRKSVEVRINRENFDVEVVG